MHNGDDYLAGLAQIHTRDDPDERRSLWRQGLASLATAAADQQPTPLEGIATDQLLASVRCAVAAKLIDDVSFLSGPVAAAALFELANALPHGAEKRELGRRVLVALHEGDAATFVTLATALALSSPRALEGAQIRARVALSLRLPLATGAHVDALALALVARPELERGWLSAYSMGALHSRRLAARLLERAAREAAKRAKEGDDSGVRVFERTQVRGAWARLITDRESLVWRHVAVARGLLAAAAPARAAEIERDLSPRLGPSEWRRAAASLSATAAHDPGTAIPACLKLLGSELQTRDSGMASSMIYGLSRVVEQEPEAADELLVKLVPCGGMEAVEALADLREEVPAQAISSRVIALAGARLREGQLAADDGMAALIAALVEDLDLGERAPGVAALSPLPGAAGLCRGSRSRAGHRSCARDSQQRDGRARMHGRSNRGRAPSNLPGLARAGHWPARHFAAARLGDGAGRESGGRPQPARRDPVAARQLAPGARATSGRGAEDP